VACIPAKIDGGHGDRQVLARKTTGRELGQASLGFGWEGEGESWARNGPSHGEGEEKGFSFIKSFFSFSYFFLKLAT
jgi:hypothetical protein